MRQAATSLAISTTGRSLVEITREVAGWVRDQAVDTGLLTVFCRHTSASLLIQENAAREVPGDIIDWLNRIAPEDGGWQHDDEGPDDMPAHLKAILTGVSLSIPVMGGDLALGTWQGIYLAEHRTRPHRRNIVLHLMGE
ncbi:secondary thiamine-phosphate synthase enzyme YjbQ [Croceicoccus marinus]|uniref:YjbQ family protein n=1 Tax=Croceicoccus marinus TaxID=450378 RepID=A0A7G6VSW4_9SPHN|nr:secondary thiamine-phosphate synthase enzyme YjbQ [Croceicoccus marinus]QNE04829.1 YjbQ family protein [Croceicoccus marinus]